MDKIQALALLGLDRREAHAVRGHSGKRKLMSLSICAIRNSSQLPTKMASSLLMLLSLIGASFAATSVSSMRVLQPTYSCGWHMDGVIEASQPVSFTVVLEEPDLGQIHSLALEVSDPSSPNYGNYLTMDQVAALSAPEPHHVQAVTSWLDGHQIAYTRVVNQFQITTTVKHAEMLLNTTFHAVTHGSLKQSVIHARQSMLPCSLACMLCLTFLMPSLGRSTFH